MLHYWFVFCILTGYPIRTIDSPTAEKHLRSMLTVVIPVLNEGKTIGNVVRFCLEHPSVSEVIVVDDKSEDDTVAAATAAGARVIISQVRGKGISMKDGIRHATNDLVIFLSVHAVMHGAHLVSLEPPTRVGAIGKATEAALTERGHSVHLVPESGFTSESLLAHPELADLPLQRVLLVRGEGGRTLLRDFFIERGATVDTLEVYRRVRPAPDEALREQVEARWAEDGIDVVTATSVETLTNLIELLSERGRHFLRSTPLLVPSGRIADAARSAGLCVY